MDSEIRIETYNDQKFRNNLVYFTIHDGIYCVCNLIKSGTSVQYFDCLYYIGNCLYYIGDIG